MLQVTPLESMHVTSPFGLRDLDHDPSTPLTMHQGTDYRAAVGTPIYAMGAGVVERAINVDSTANGKHVVVVDDDDGRYIYLHLDRVDVVEGDRVRAGSQVGLTGQTGAAEGPHLHLQWQPHGAGAPVADIAPVLALLPAPSSARTGSSITVALGLGGLTYLLWRLLRRKKRAR